MSQHIKKNLDRKIIHKSSPAGAGFLFAVKGSTVHCDPVWIIVVLTQWHLKTVSATLIFALFYCLQGAKCSENWIASQTITWLTDRRAFGLRTPLTIHVEIPSMSDLLSTWMIFTFSPGIHSHLEYVHPVLQENQLFANYLNSLNYHFYGTLFLILTFRWIPVNCLPWSNDPILWMHEPFNFLR